MSGHTPWAEIKHKKEQAVRVVSFTSNAEELILYIARVSSNQENTDTGLLRYLIRNQHWSPFEHAMLTLEIVTSRAIATQILRHRSFTFQEFSQRYANATRIIQYPGRKQSETNRQSSTSDLDEETQKWWRDLQHRRTSESITDYNTALNRGVAKELARFILPLATETKLYMSGTLRSWIHYITQRTDEHTQLEHRVLAEEAQEHFVDLFPVISEALSWEGPKIPDSTLPHDFISKPF